MSLDLDSRKKEIEEEFNRLSGIKQQVDTRLLQLQGQWEVINELLQQPPKEEKLVE